MDFEEATELNRVMQKKLLPDKSDDDEKAEQEVEATV